MAVELAFLKAVTMVDEKASLLVFQSVVLRVEPLVVLRVVQ